MSDDMFEFSFEVLRVTEDQGATLTGHRHALFFFYGDEEDLPPFQEALEAMGFSVGPTAGKPGRIAEIIAAVDDDWLGDMMVRLAALCEQHGVEYDGWEVSLDEQQLH
jgi:hypothetical protein